MGQKVNPIIFRLGVSEDWTSCWYADKKSFRENLYSDFLIRKFIYKNFPNTAISLIEIKRSSNSVEVSVHTARPGMLIGKSGKDVELLKQNLRSLIGVVVQINVIEIRKAELNAFLVAGNIANQLEQRVSFRRVMKRSMANAMRLGAQGIKVRISGRIGGTDIARSEWLRNGRMPLHTLRERIDYAMCEAKTTYGIIGVKVWICKSKKDITTAPFEESNINF